MADPQDSASDPWLATAARVTQPPAEASGQPDDPWAQTAAQVRPQAAQAPPPAQTEPQPQAASDPWAQTASRLGTPGMAARAQPAQGQERLGEGESWYNRPVSTYFGIPEYRQGAGGVERAVEKFGSSLTSPLSLGLLLVTGGVGGVAEAGAAEAAGGVAEGLAGKFGSSVLSRLAPETAAAVAKAANTVTRATSAGFTLQQVGAIASQLPRLSDAIKAGDWDTGGEMLTSALLEGAVAAMTGYVAARGIPQPGEPALGHDKYITRAEQREVDIAGVQSKAFYDANKPLIKDKNTDIAALLYHNAGGDVSVLEREQEALKDNTKLSTAAKQRVNGWLETAQNLPDSYKQLSAGLVPKYAGFAAELKRIGEIDPLAKLPANYGGQHTYALDSEGDSNLNFNGRRPPDFLKKRTFGDIFEAIREGYEPNRGLASNYANYVREMGQVRGINAAVEEAKSRTAKNGSPVAYAAEGVRSIDNKPAMAMPRDLEVKILQQWLGPKNVEPGVGDIDPATKQMILQPKGTAKEQLALARESVPAYGQILNDISESVPGVTVTEPNVKGEPRTLEKLADPRKNLTPETNSDYIRARVSVPDVDAINAVVDHLRSNGLLVGGSADDFTQGGGKGGYRAVHVNIQLPGGNTAELQIVPQEISEVQDQSHKLYEKVRGSGKAGETANAALTGQMRQLLDEAHSRYIDRTSGFSKSEPADSTGRQFFNQKSERWDATTRAAHDNFAEQLFAGHQPQEHPEITITGGGTASGKTTFSKQLMAGGDRVRIEPDEIQLEILKRRGLQNTPENQARVGFEARALARDLLAKATARKLNVVFDSTTTGIGNADVIRGLQQDGYKVHLKFFDIPVEEAIRRQAHRFANSTDPTTRGRDVSTETIKQTHARAATDFFDWRSRANTAELYDTQVPKGSPSRIIYERGEDGGERIHDQARLDQFRSKYPGAAGPAPYGPGSAAVLANLSRGEGAPGPKTPAQLAKLARDSGLLVKDGKLYFDLSNYKPGPDAFGKFYKYKGTDKDTGNRYFEKSNVMVHPDYRDALMKSFQDTSWFRNKPLLQAALKTTTGAKNLLLSFSPFHWTTEYLRGIQMGLNPIEAMRPPKLTAESPAVTAKFGPSLGADSRARQLMEEGTTGVVSKIPGIGKLWEQASNHLFGEYIPRLKAATWERVVDQLSKRHSNWSEDQVQFAASKIVDAAYGGLNWRQLGVDMTTRDALRLFMLAPDFSGSQLLFAKSAFEPGGSVVRNSLMRIAAYNFMAARVLNLLHTGDSHLEHPFSVVSEDGKKTYSMRTMPSDIWHALSDPRSFLSNRLSPITKAGFEYLSGRDQQGKRIEGQQQLFNMIRNVLPIPVQSLAPGLRRADETMGESGLRALGFAPEPNRSAADTLAIKLASDRSESGPVNKESLEKHQKMIQMEDDLRTGAKSWDDLRQAYAAGEISKKDADAIIKNSRVTKNMEPGMIRLYTRATRLPMKDFLEVWSIATPQEREALKPLYDKKRQEYLRTAAKNLSPAGLAQDALYGKLRQMHPNEPPW